MREQFSEPTKADAFRHNSTAAASQLDSMEVWFASYTLDALTTRIQAADSAHRQTFIEGLAIFCTFR